MGAGGGRWHEAVHLCVIFVRQKQKKGRYSRLWSTFLFFFFGGFQIREEGDPGKVGLA